MAKFFLFSPFPYKAEGGHVNDKTDKGGETMRGITWKLWTYYFGDTDAYYNRFLAMELGDWETIIKKEFWDKILGDSIVSQRIANAIADWVLNSGTYFPELDIEELINHIFHTHLVEDGIFGPATIAAINAADEPSLYQSILARHRQFYHDIVDSDKAKIIASKGITVYNQMLAAGETQAKFLDGWLNRIDNLDNYNKTLKAA